MVVHCHAGINRSGVIAAALMMLRTNSSVLETVAHCRRQRGNAFLWNRTCDLGAEPVSAPVLASHLTSTPPASRPRTLIDTFQKELVALARNFSRLALNCTTIEKYASDQKHSLSHFQHLSESA